MQNIAKGETIFYNGKKFSIVDDIPAKHKFFEQDMNVGDEMMMYGVLVGKAQNFIATGSRMTTDNTKHAAESYQYRDVNFQWQPPDVSKFKNKTFNGYYRSDGSVGTANWAATSGPNTYVQGAPVGTDNVLFDDSVGGATATVNLTTTLTPGTLGVNNTAVNYVWQGAGKLSGATSIAKIGTGTLRIANTTANDNTGATSIGSGTLIVGDGVTAGAGSLGGGGININPSGVLTFDRPDNYTQAGAITSSGTLNKNQSKHRHAQRK